MNVLRSLTSLLLCIFLAVNLTACRDESIGSGPHISVQLVADESTIEPGKEFHIGVHFKPDPGWHVYWKNPGDSGLAPTFAWKVSEGLSIIEALWPTPERIMVGPLVNYGYDDVLIPFRAKVSGSDTVTIQSSLQWLVCKDECLPGKTSLTLKLPVGLKAVPSSNAPSFKKTLNEVPLSLEDVSIAVEEQDSQVIVSIIPLKGEVLPRTALFFPEDPKVIDNAAPQSSSGFNGALKMTLKRARNRIDPITRIRGVIVSEEGFGTDRTQKAVRIDTDPNEETSDLAVSSVTTLPSITFSKSTAGTPGFGIALILAILGGLILNLMPCVFPVLSIKILSFIEHAGAERRKIRLHGLCFSAGVIASFWALAATLLILRAGGEELGWGFQLQSPLFIVSMIFVFFGLSLTFLSDVAIGNTIQRLAGSSKLPTSYIGSFFNGVLATAVATPCTGPFMSSALAATLTLPAFPSLLIFTALGVGMSLPYLVLSFEPRLLRFLPRPGMWMETFKQFMAFPLLASVAWLLRVFARQIGLDPVGLTLLMNVIWGILLCGFGFWLLIRSGHRRSILWRRTLQIAGIAGLIYGIILAIPTEHEIQQSRDRSLRSQANQPEPDSHGLLWEPYSEARLKELLHSGRPVYLDFTAEWCITCQVNDQVVFSSAQVQELLKTKNVALMKGDWTSMNSEITAALKRYERNGVPLNVLLKEDRPPVILPNILTAGIVIEELEKL